MKKGASSVILAVLLVLITITLAGTTFFWITSTQETLQGGTSVFLAEATDAFLTDSEQILPSFYATEKEGDPHQLADFQTTICNVGKNSVDMSLTKSILIKDLNDGDNICAETNLENVCLGNDTYVVGGYHLNGSTAGSGGTLPSITYSKDGMSWTNSLPTSAAESIWGIEQFAVTNTGSTSEVAWAVSNKSLGSGKLLWSADLDSWDFKSNSSIFSLSKEINTNNDLFMGINESPGAAILRVNATLDGSTSINLTEVASLTTGGSPDFDGVHALFTNGSVYLAGTGGTDLGRIYMASNRDWSGVSLATGLGTYSRITDFAETSNRIYATATDLGGSAVSDVIYSTNGGSSWSSASFPTSNADVRAALDDPDDSGNELYVGYTTSAGTANLIRYDGSSWGSDLNSWSNSRIYDLIVENETGYFYAGIGNEGTSQAEIWRSGPNLNDANWTLVYSNSTRAAVSALNLVTLCNQQKPVCTNGCDDELEPGECEYLRIALEDSSCDLSEFSPESLFELQFTVGKFTETFRFKKFQDFFDSSSLEGTIMGTPVAGAVVNTPILSSTNPTTNDTSENLTLQFEFNSTVVTAAHDWRVNTTTSNLASIAVLNMPFNNQSSSFVKDYSSFDNDGTDNGATWKNSTICSLTGSGGCYSFNGTDNEITLADNALDGVGSVGTVSAWINIEENLASNDAILSYGDSAGTSYYYAFSIDTSERPVVGVRLASTSFAWSLTADSGISTGAWHHVAAVQSDTEEPKIYVDGSEVSASLSETGVVAEETYFDDLASNAELTGIGSFRRSTTTNYFNGSIDNVHFYNRTLSAEQISAIYNTGVPRYNITVSQETRGGEEWRVHVTPNNGQQDFDTSISNTIFVNESVAPNITLLNITDEDDRQIFNQTEDAFINTTLTFNATVTDTESGVDSVWIIIWENVIGGAVKAMEFMTNIFGNVWSVTIDTNDSFTSSVYNFTVYANDTLNNTRELNDTFTVNHRPTSSSPLITSTTAINHTLGNLSAVNQSFNDVDNDALTAIYDWRLNGTSITVINMPFDSKNTTGAKDYSTFRNDGVVNGSTWLNFTSCGLGTGGCYSFDGTSGYINLGDVDDSEGSGRASVAAWVYLPAGVNHDTTEIPASKFDGTDAPFQMLACNGTENSGVEFGVYFESSTGDVSRHTADSVATTGAWSFVTLVLDSSQSAASDRAKLYINSELQSGSGTATGCISSTQANFGLGAVMDNNNGDLVIAGRDNGASIGNLFEGYIDNFQFYNRSLTQTQIETIYNEGDPRYNLTALNETGIGQNWSVAVTPNDGQQDGLTFISDNITILNAPPNSTNPILNTTNISTNGTSDNLTAYNQSFTENIDFDPFIAIYDWRLEGRSLAIINFPFELNNNDTIKSYSTIVQNGTGTTTSVKWKNSTFCISGGCLEFDLGTIGTFSPSVADIALETSVEAWVNLSSTTDMDFWGNDFFNSGGGLVLESGTLRTLINNASSSPVDTGFAPNANQWYHIVQVYAIDGTRTYVNGTLIHESSLNLDECGCQGFILGNLGGLDVNPNYQGLMDDFILWNVSLTHDQIKANYNNGVPRHSVITSNLTSHSQNWTVAVTPSDFISDGVTRFANLTLNIPPTSGTPILLSTDISTNSSVSNLSVQNISFSDVNGEPITAIYDWRINGTSIAELNLAFDTKNRSAVKDHSTNGNHGSVVGALWKYDGSCGLGTGGCYNFSDDKYIEIGNTSTFKFLHGAEDTSGFKWTIEWWMQMDTPEPNTLYGIASTGTIGTSASVAMDLWYDDRSSVPRSRTFALLIARGVGGQVVCCTTSFSDNIYPNDAGWHHVVVTYDQSLSSGNAKVYVDGDFQDSLTKNAFTPSTSNSANPLHIGIFGGESVAPYAGSLDNYKIYNHTLSPGQIRANYNNGVPRYNLTHSNDTSPFERWTVAVTPNDGVQDGDTQLSNELNVTGPEVILHNITDQTGAIVNATEPADIGDTITFNVTEGPSSAPIDRFWVVIWENVIGGVVKAIEFFTDVLPGMWQADIAINDSFTSSIYNFTVFANDTANVTTRIDGTFAVSSAEALILNSTDPTTNDTTENLTATYVPDPAPSTVIYDWRINSTTTPGAGGNASIAEVNYQFDTDNSTGVHDYSSNNRHGTITNAVWKNSTICGLDSTAGGCYEFDGSGDYIALPTSDIISGNPFTVVAWAQTDTVSGTGPHVILSQSRTILYHENSRFRYQRGDSGFQTVVQANNAVNTTAWYHVVLVHNGTAAGDTQLYINGTNDCTNCGAVAVPDASATGTNYIGFQTPAGPRYWDGKIDGLMVFDFALTGEQIQTLYNDGLPQHTVIHNANTSAGQNWTVQAVVNNETTDVTTKLSNNLLVLD